MKIEWLALSRKYQAALEEHLRQSPKFMALSAYRLGQEAVLLGLGTRDLARIHKATLPLLHRSHHSAPGRLIARQAQAFYCGALLPIEMMRRTGKEASAQASRKTTTMTKRMTQLGATNHGLKQGLHERKTVEEALRKNGTYHAKLLRESHHLQKQLRHLAHQLLSRQEAERKMISHELHNGIAQTLLGINARLLSLKKTAKGNPGMLTKEIASTQRVVEESVKSINRFAHELDIHRTA